MKSVVKRGRPIGTNYKSQAIQKELEIIASKEKGVLYPADVVKFAENPKTELHGHFCWDDTEAAEQWRLHQARMLISIQVKILRPGKKPIMAWFNARKTRHSEDGGYKAIERVLNDKTMKALMLKEAYEEMNYFIGKYRAITEVAGVISEMKKVLHKSF